MPGLSSLSSIAHTKIVLFPVANSELDVKNNEPAIIMSNPIKITTNIAIISFFSYSCF